MEGRKKGSKTKGMKPLFWKRVNKRGWCSLDGQVGQLMAPLMDLAAQEKLIQPAKGQSKQR